MPQKKSVSRPRKSQIDYAALAELFTSLSDDLDKLHFQAPVAHVYNPLAYARDNFFQYLQRFGTRRGRVLLLGMNPGPWGMAQTGIAFGEVNAVRDWLKLDGTINRPAREHPKRKIDGMNCTRSEVSGARLWGFARDRFGTPTKFFRTFFVGNYCPLAFLGETGANITPDKIAREDRAALLDRCDEALRAFVGLTQPRMIVGIGTFAENRARAVLDDSEIPIARILHPSPASPAANRDWAGTVSKQLAELGITFVD